ncbi:uncharacterized protein B0I36DRAFT_61312 [Microdochium trichocladiopsis]|uniref:Uncharacterized protein n=1 Tax=Microdochium trichocladiopsis TaxID=1682393 RepID=A0A9P8YFI9_9PEZI|nr:uncharacterized protein B0I36DRAFT_61312 [Microdochium trichocladiopsis]KAH7037035.1 hypothetical protein B0I36DRAFT_61312 [Microdochium trichocladiopsis]
MLDIHLPLGLMFLYSSNFIQPTVLELVQPFFHICSHTYEQYFPTPRSSPLYVFDPLRDRTKHHNDRVLTMPCAETSTGRTDKQKSCSGSCSKSGGACSSRSGSTKLGSPTATLEIEDAPMLPSVHSESASDQKSPVVPPPHRHRPRTIRGHT